MVNVNWHQVTNDAGFVTSNHIFSDGYF